MAKQNFDLLGIHRILDANLNRTAEGLRVLEEVSRFILNDRRTSSRLKEIRHRVNKDLKNIIAKNTDLLSARDTIKDVGRIIPGREFERKNYSDIFFANMQRVKESVRVLEEFSKLLNKKIALDFKKIRYEIYAIEKNVTAQVRALRHSR